MLTLNRTKNDLYANTNILSYYTNNTGIKGYWVRDKGSLRKKSNICYIMSQFRMFLTKTQDPDNTLGRALSDAEKLQFVSKSVFWIQGKDTMDSCFILNFGYEASLPWPQVRIYWGKDNLGQNFGS